MDIVLRLSIIEKSLIVKLETRDTGIGSGGQSDGVGSNLRADIPLADMADAIVPAPTLPHEILQPVPTRESVVQSAGKRSPLKALLASRPFLVASWGTTVQAILLTAFDSVRLRLLLADLANDNLDPTTLRSPDIQMELPRCRRNHDSSPRTKPFITSHRIHR